MVVVEVRGESYYMNPRLKIIWDKIKDGGLAKKDEDRCYIIDGREGCLVKGSKILMSNGTWNNVENIKLGDKILSPQEDGSYVYANVINLFHFKSKDIYDVCELNRQKRKLYSCSYNHNIPMNVKDRKDETWKTIHFTAEELHKKGKEFMKRSTTNTMFKVNQFENKGNCKIEPYTLGVWLGDGNFSSNKRKKDNPLYDKQTIVKGHWRNLKSGKRIWQKEHNAEHHIIEHRSSFHRGVAITTMDLELIEYISNYYPIMSFFSKQSSKAKSYAFSLLSDFSKLLIFYGLEGKGNGDKFIPKEALTSDIDYRKKLLAGLIDTDGYLSQSCSYSITTKSEQLAKDIEFLVYSLGGRCAIRKVKKGIKSRNFIGTYFCVSFYLGDIGLPILLERKKRNGNFSYISANRISIELKKREGEFVYGFELDSKSHWYIGDNYVVQKNSGKSWFTIQQAAYIDPTILDDEKGEVMPRICFSVEEVLKAIRTSKSTREKTIAIVFDEAFRGLSSKSSISKINKSLVQAMMEMRQNNLVLFIVSPSFFHLEMYAAIHRSTTLFHIMKAKSTGKRMFKAYNFKKKARIYQIGLKKGWGYPEKSKNKDYFFNKFPGGKKEEDRYRRKKYKSLISINVEEEKEGKFKQQRDMMIYQMKEKGKTYKEIIKEFKDCGISITRQNLTEIYNKYAKLMGKKPTMVEIALKNMENSLETRESAQI